MISRFAWVDFDQKAQMRSQSILALFNERQSVDELGIGGVRDSFADLLFPGTSTIQTRLRYMLFIPWIYRDLEKRQASSRQIETQARDYEISLINGLQKTNPNETGIIGVAAGQSLRRLPSVIYWSGLGELGIRKFDRSQAQYHESLDEIYRARKRCCHSPELCLQDGRGEINRLTMEPLTWDPSLPEKPKSGKSKENFPDHISFHLSRDEALYLQERIRSSHPSSLFAHLTLLDTRVENAACPWEHPEYSEFSNEHKHILYHARLFSLAMHGASLLYNLLLARKCNSNELEQRHEKNLYKWGNESDITEIKAWSDNLTPFWQCIENQEHFIGRPTRDFIKSWSSLAGRIGIDIINDTEAQNIIRQREQYKKKGNSRFRNHRALEQWGGNSGTERLSFRWPNARILLNDLYEGLKSK